MKNNNLKRPGQFTVDETLRISRSCGWEEELSSEEFNENHITWRYAKVLDHDIFLGIEWDGEVICYIDWGSTVESTISPATGAVLIRWLLKAWKDILSVLSFTTPLDIYCTPESNDGYYWRRVELFEKLGFKFVKDGKMFYYQGSSRTI